MSKTETIKRVRSKLAYKVSKAIKNIKPDDFEYYKCYLEQAQDLSKLDESDIPEDTLQELIEISGLEPTCAT